MATVTIYGQEYSVRELSLLEKMQLMKTVFPLLKDLMLNQKGGELPLTAAINLLLGLLECTESIVLTLFKLSVPDYGGAWGDIPESQLRAPLSTVMDVNDFGGFTKHFLSLGQKIKSSINS